MYKKTIRPDPSNDYPEREYTQVSGKGKHLYVHVKLKMKI